MSNHIHTPAAQLAARILAQHIESGVPIRDFIDSHPADLDDMAAALGATLSEVLDARAYMVFWECVIPVAATEYGSDEYSQALEFGDSEHPRALHARINDEHMRAPLTHKATLLRDEAEIDTWEDYALVTFDGMPRMSADPDTDTLIIERSDTFEFYAIGAYSDLPTDDEIADMIDRRES